MVKNLTHNGTKLCTAISGWKEEEEEVEVEACQVSVHLFLMAGGIVS